jgi:hypothetical protein
MQPSTEELNSNDVQAPSTSTASMTQNLQQNSSLALEDVKGKLLVQKKTVASRSPKKSKKPIFNFFKQKE